MEQLDIHGNKLTKGIYEILGGTDSGDIVFIGAKPQSPEVLLISKYRMQRESNTTLLSTCEGGLSPVDEKKIEQIKPSIKGFYQILKKVGLEQTI